MAKLQIDIGKIRLNKKVLKELVERIMKKKVRRIRRGKVIRKAYTRSTKQKRQKHGLQHRFVDLTGNIMYSRKSWRLLDSWEVKVVDKDKAIVMWSRPRAAEIYGYQMRRYGKVLKRA